MKIKKDGERLLVLISYLMGMEIHCKGTDLGKSIRQILDAVSSNEEKEEEEVAT